MFVFSNGLYASTRLPLDVEFGMTKEQVKEKLDLFSTMIDKEDNNLLSYTSPPTSDGEIQKLFFHFDDNKLTWFELFAINLSKEQYQLKAKMIVDALNDDSPEGM